MPCQTQDLGDEPEPRLSRLEQEEVRMLYRIPGSDPVELEVGVDGINSLVGGEYEIITFCDDLAAWICADGKRLGLPFNFSLFEGKDYVAGPVVFTHGSTDAESNTLGITDYGIELAKEVLRGKSIR